jgi:RNA polymerase sigma-70 factor (ECF subfamily)
MHSTPVSLLERLRQPVLDQAAWARFVQLYTPLLHHWAGRLGVPPSDIPDLLQEVFSLLVRKLPAFVYDRNGRFRGWLWTVLCNKFREAQRRKSPEPLPEPELIRSGPTAPDVADEVLEADYRQHLCARALQIMQAEFQPTTWKACWEHVVSGRPAAEVAAELGLSEGAVYVAKHRVLRRLRQELEGLLE